MNRCIEYENTGRSRWQAPLGVSSGGSELSEWHHECEWTAAADAEADLQKHFIHCPKNPGHKNFIPVGQFNIGHLPQEFRDEDMVEWIKLIADLTMKVCVRHVSVDRPETCPDTEEGKYIPDYKDKVGGGYPFSEVRGRDILRTGTAFVLFVHRYKGQCRCEVNCPHKDWGKVKLYTARHVVYNSSEAEKSDLIFHYDSEENREKIRVERGRGVGHCSTEEDVCEMFFYSHDVKFLDCLEEILERKNILWEKLLNKYFKPRLDDTLGVTRGDTLDFNSRYEPPNPRLPVIIISHPHGRAKMVTIGKVTEVLEGEEDKHSRRYAVYNYTTDTCPGSSGARVCFVERRWWSMWESKWKFGLFPAVPHSQRVETGGNRSAGEWMWLW